MFNKVFRIWNLLIGKPQDFSLENRAFNAISVITLVLLLILIPLNLLFKLWVVSGMLLIITAVQYYLYYMARFKKQFKNSLNIYAGASYLILIVTFIFNAGSNGPAIYLFFLTYLLLIAFTPHPLHRLWTLLHIAVPVSLLCIEHYWPAAFITPYPAEVYRFFDLTSTYAIIIVCIYSATTYLRSNYDREKHLAHKHALRIMEQNERIQLQNEELQQLNTEKIKLISIIAHDLRNPLNAITGVLEVLTREDLNELKRKKLNTELLHVSRNTSEMLTNLLSWTSRQIKGLKPVLSNVVPGEVIDQVLRVQTMLARKKHIQIRTTISPGIEILADTDMLELVIRNLINNALKFTTANGEVHIRSELDSDGKYCIISVSDNGIGISDTHIDELFNAGIKSTYGTENEKGIGLGLFLCKEFIVIQRGKIRVESILGKGTTFSISLPLFSVQEIKEPALESSQ